ncbi:MAG: 2-phospho-L-lactate transferase, partial [Gaiellaceae bacterium]
MASDRSICVLAGGVGAARFIDGLVGVHDPADIAAIVNVGDDFEHLGLSISPDIDTLLYTLGGVVHPRQGWGRAEETTHALGTVTELGGEDWFLLGDRDIGLHLVRTAQLRAGSTLSEVTASLAAHLGITTAILPATDDRLRTIVETTEGDFDFQTYFVRRQHRDEVNGFHYDGAASATPASGVLEAIAGAKLLIVAPSNPFLSIAPILSVPAIDEAVRSFTGPIVGISPLIGGRAIKGPADRLLARIAGTTSASAVAGRYEGILTHFLLDDADADDLPALAKAGVGAAATDILMRDRAAREHVARAALELVAAD